MGDIPNVSFSSLQTMITSETPLEIKIRFETCIELFSKYSDLELVSKIMSISKSTVKTYLEISKMPDEIIEIALKFDKPKIIAEVAYLVGLMPKAQKQSDDSKINQLDLFATLLSASIPYSSLSSGILSRKKCPMCNSKKIAGIIYGNPSPGLFELFQKEREKGLERRISVGGDVLHGNDPAYECNSCHCKWGVRGDLNEDHLLEKIFYDDLEEITDIPKLVQDNLGAIHPNPKTAVALALKAVTLFKPGYDVPPEKVLTVAKKLGEKKKSQEDYKKLKQAAEENDT